MSSTTSQKFRDFTGEPLKDKVLSEVPGLGPKLAGNLESTGITKVRRCCCSSERYSPLRFL